MVWAENIIRIIVALQQFLGALLPLPMDERLRSDGFDISNTMGSFCRQGTNIDHLPSV